MNISRILPVAIPVAQTWMQSQRKRYRSADAARPLIAAETAVLSPFFRAELLESVRLRELNELPNTWFYPVLRWLRIDLPLDMPHAHGVTFGDTIVIVRSPDAEVAGWYPLLFHELVHVVQYSKLGFDPFIANYLRAFAAAGTDYFGNAFEREAFELDRRFESAPNLLFSVEAEVLNSGPSWPTVQDASRLFHLHSVEVMLAFIVFVARAEAADGEQLKIEIRFSRMHRLCAWGGSCPASWGGN